MTISAINVRGLTKRYGFHRALKGIDLDLKPGVCALLGPNGAGKSTLLGVLSTLIRPTGGSVAFASQAGELATGAFLRSQIGVLAHESFLYGGLNASENLRFWGELYQVSGVEERAVAVLREVGLEESAWDRPCATYSRGMTQRLALARTMLHQPSVLLLDEPFTGLDRGGSVALTQSLQRWVEQGTLVLVVTHDLESIGGITDHVVVLNRGKLAHEGRSEAYTFHELRDLYNEYTQ